ncbi:MAG: transposase [Sandaracinaceae bacterium]|nr:transposase [Sandaracinaceae bacterium]
MVPEVRTPLTARRDLAERGVPLAMGTLVSFIERAADLLAPVDGYHWRQLLAGSWMATDGTGLKVLVPKLPVAHNGYIELYRNEDLAVFQYEADKSSESVVSKLAPFVGKLTADAEHRFNAVFETGRVIETGCNAHGRRKFRDAEATQPGLAKEGGAFIGAIYGEEDKAQALGLVGEALREHRQRYIRPIANDFEVWLAAVEPVLLPSEPLMAAVRYYRNHRDALFRFIDDPDAHDNSPTERAPDRRETARTCLRGQLGRRPPRLRPSASWPPAAPSGCPCRPTFAWAFERLRHPPRRSSLEWRT